MKRRFLLNVKMEAITSDEGRRGLTFSSELELEGDGRMTPSQVRNVIRQLCNNLLMAISDSELEAINE